MKAEETRGGPVSHSRGHVGRSLAAQGQAFTWEFHRAEHNQVHNNPFPFHVIEFPPEIISQAAHLPSLLSYKQTAIVMSRLTANLGSDL